MNRIYHLHIPRTSGTGILYSIHRSFALDRTKKGITSNHRTTPEIFEFIYDHEQMSDWPVISGHFGRNPVDENNGNLSVFSIIREPVDHFVSLAAYRAMTAKKHFDYSFFDKFLNGDFEGLLDNQLFSSRGNLQTKMLTCRIFDIWEIIGEKTNTQSEAKNHHVWFVESDLPSTPEELIAAVSDFNLFPMEKRHFAESWLIDKFIECFNVELILNTNEKTNASIRNGFYPSPEQIKEIINRNNLDMALYEHVMSRHGNE